MVSRHASTVVCAAQLGAGDTVSVSEVEEPGDCAVTVRGADEARRVAVSKMRIIVEGWVACEVAKKCGLSFEEMTVL